MWKYGERPGAIGYNPHCAFAPYVCTYCKCGDFLKEAARCSFCVVLMAERVWCCAHLERCDWAQAMASPATRMQICPLHPRCQREGQTCSIRMRLIRVFRCVLCTVLIQFGFVATSRFVPQPDILCATHPVETGWLHRVYLGGG